MNSRGGSLKNIYIKRNENTHYYAPELFVLCNVEGALFGQDLYVLHVVVVPVGH